MHVSMYRFYLTLQHCFGCSGCLLHPTGLQYMGQHRVMTRGQAQTYEQGVWMMLKTKFYIWTYVPILMPDALVVMFASCGSVTMGALAPLILLLAPILIIVCRCEGRIWQPITGSQACNAWTLRNANNSVVLTHVRVPGYVLQHLKDAEAMDDPLYR